MYRRKVMAAASVVLAASLAAACSSSGSPSGSGSASDSQPPDVKIMVGGMSKQIYLPNILTQKLGYFKDQGLNVTLIDEASGQSSEAEVLAGQVQGGSGSYNHTIELQAQGKAMECVVQLTVAPGEAEMVSTKEAGSIKTAADLKGKNLGITELGSGTQTLTEAIVGRAGLSSKDAHFIPVGAGATFIAAMQQGKIDAGMTTEPTISKLLSTGTGKVLFDLRTPTKTQSTLGGNYPWICVFMNSDYVNAHKALTQKVVNAYVKTLKWINTHTPAQIADQVPADYYAGDKAAYISALAGEMAMFSPDGTMPSDGPATALDIENKYVSTMIGKGSSIDLAKTYTDAFAKSAG